MHGSPWDSWLGASLGDLRSRSLLRSQRPTIATGSSTEALIPRGDLRAWVDGSEPIVNVYSGGGSERMGSNRASLHLPEWERNTEDADLAHLMLFSLNDYLGLASHPEVCRAASDAARQVGMGPRSSAVVGGTTTMHRELEVALAELKGTQDCLLFPTGFAANMAVIMALCDGGNVDVFSDELNHASIVDGARLAVRSGGTNKLHVYRHNDLAHLEQLLLRSRGHDVASGTASSSVFCAGNTGSEADSTLRSHLSVQSLSGRATTLAHTPSSRLSPVSARRRQLVVTDSLFSMDGDFADLKALAALKQQYGFLLVIDEAHATLVCGERGAGAAEAMGVADQVDVHVGTMSKAFGAMGGFVATSNGLKQLLINRGRSYIYSTALPMPVVAACQASLRVSARESWRRTHLWSLVDRLGELLDVPALSPVVPLVLGGEREALQASMRLLQGGRHVPAIRPPTVPPGTCRLRVSLSAAHSMRDVEQLAEAVVRCGCKLQRLPFLVQQQQQQLRGLGIVTAGSIDSDGVRSERTHAFMPVSRL